MTILFRRSARGDAGFMLAPLLYMLVLAGIGAAVLFSGYSQILRSNAQMTAINSARSQLQAADTTLAASSALDSATSTIVQPPAVYAFGSIAGGDTAKLPTNYTNASTTGSPHDVGVIDTSVGVRQLDPWGKFYIYCRWENAVSSPTSPSIMVITAGPDGNLDTKCGDTNAQGDDKIVSSTVAETINRANVWQVSSSSQVKYGIAANPVAVNADGSITASMLTLGAAPAATNSGQLSVVSANVSGALTAGSSTFSGATINGNATISGTLGVTGATTLSSTLSAGASTLSSAAISGNATVGGTLGVTGNTTLSGTLTAGASALSSLTLGTALAIAQGGTGATTASAALTNLGGLAIANNLSELTATAATARTNLGLGTMATQNANAVAITGGTITGVDLTGSSGGTAGSVAAGNVTGCCVAISAGGTGSATAAAARSALGTDNASNLTSGTVSATLLPTSGVTPGTYTQVTVDQYGRVTVGANNSTSQWTNSGSDIYFNTGKVGIGVANPTDELSVGTAYSQLSSSEVAQFGNGTNSAYITVRGVNGPPNNQSTTAGLFGLSSANPNIIYLDTYGIDHAGAPVATQLSFRLAGTEYMNISTSGVTASNFIGNLTGNVTGNITGNISLADGSAGAPSLYFTNETNTGIYRPAAKTFAITAYGADVARFIGTGNLQVNSTDYFTFSNAGIGSDLSLGAAGSDTNISIDIQGKGTGGINLISNGATAFAVSNGSSTVNYLSVIGSATGSAVTVAPLGSDTNISLAINGKGTGSIVHTAQAASAVVEVNKGATSQTGDLQEWQDSTGAVLGEVNASGNLGIGVTSTTDKLNVGSNYAQIDSNEEAQFSNGTTTGYTAFYGYVAGGTKQNPSANYAAAKVGATADPGVGVAFVDTYATGGSPPSALPSQLSLRAGGTEYVNIGTGNVVITTGNLGLPASAYLNFGSTMGSSGYGIRDNAGTIELKNSGGSWAAPLTASSTITANNFAAGSVGSPGLYVVGDSDTGFYSPAANTLSVTTGGVEVERWNTVASGVNYLSITPAATGNNPSIGVAGSDTNIGITLAPKGTGAVTINNALTLTGGTVTASTPPVNITQTWNSGGVTFTVTVR
jgi:hypothetical protein